MELTTAFEALGCLAIAHLCRYYTCMKTSLNRKSGKSEWYRIDLRFYSQEELELVKKAVTASRISFNTWMVNLAVKAAKDQLKAMKS